MGREVGGLEGWRGGGEGEIQRSGGEGGQEERLESVRREMVEERRGRAGKGARVEGRSGRHGGQRSMGGGGRDGARVGECDEARSAAWCGSGPRARKGARRLVGR